MVMHSKTGLALKEADDLETAGILEGHLDGDTIWVMDVIPIPVRATNVSIEMTDASNIYMANHEEFLEKCAGVTNRVGWFHSHPGFGTFLSGTDVKQQQIF